MRNLLVLSFVVMALCASAATPGGPPGQLQITATISKDAAGVPVPVIDDASYTAYVADQQTQATKRIADNVAKFPAKGITGASQIDGATAWIVSEENSKRDKAIGAALQAAADRAYQKYNAPPKLAQTPATATN